jgi:hypothetical protein
MKNDKHDREFFDKCKQTDFSAYSANKEENLNRLIDKLNNTDNEEGNVVMHKKFKRPMAFGIAVAALLCFSMVVYGQDLVRIIRTITLSNNVDYDIVSVTDENGKVPVPEELNGQVFDEYGNALTHMPEDGKFYNSDGKEVQIFYDADTRQAYIVSANEIDTDKEHNELIFTDIEEGTEHFATDVLMPEYLPEGYRFDRIAYYADSVDALETQKGANEYMSVYYTNGEHELRSQVRFTDEGSSYKTILTEFSQEITINGYDAVLDTNTLDVQIGDVLYMFLTNDSVNADELVKIAESLK